MAAKNVSKASPKGGMSKTAAKSSKKKAKVIAKMLGGKPVVPVKVIMPKKHGFGFHEMFGGAVEGKKGFVADSSGNPILWSNIDDTEA